MCNLSQLQPSFHFPACAEWKLETHILQWLTRTTLAVSGLILSAPWKQRFYLSQHIENIEFPVSGVSTPTGGRQPETGPAHRGRVPCVTTGGVGHE